VREERKESWEDVTLCEDCKGDALAWNFREKVKRGNDSSSWVGK